MDAKTPAKSGYYVASPGVMYHVDEAGTTWKAEGEMIVEMPDGIPDGVEWQTLDPEDFEFTRSTANG